MRARRVQSGLVGFALSLVFAVFAPNRALADPVDLVGTWYVLIHYRDANTAHPEKLRWEDRVWVFEEKRGQLVWTEYPIVVFEDTQGRFERLGSNPRSRVVHAWEPNEAQRKQIKDGLEINTRGSKSKGLRGSPKRGFKSSGGLRTASAAVIGYHETWAIDDPTGLPEFSRSDSLGSGAQKGLEGVTRYATESVSDSGLRLRGTYDRDGTRKGEFKMMRAGEVKSVGTKKSQKERLYEAWGITEDGVPPEEAEESR